VPGFIGTVSHVELSKVDAGFIEILDSICALSE
jgi:hypothetical protein